MHKLGMHAGVTPDVVTYNVAISACRGSEQSTLPSGLLQQAFEVAADMRTAGLAPDAFTYTTLLGLCARAGNGRAALALYQARSACCHRPLDLPRSRYFRCVLGMWLA